MGSGTVATIGLPVGEPERVPHLGNILEHFERGEIYDAREGSADGAPHIYGAYRYAPLTETREIFFKYLDSRYINEVHTRHIEHEGFHGGALAYHVPRNEFVEFADDMRGVGVIHSHADAGDSHAGKGIHRRFFDVTPQYLQIPVDTYFRDVRTPDGLAYKEHKSHNDADEYRVVGPQHESDEEREECDEAVGGREPVHCAQPSDVNERNRRGNNNSRQHRLWEVGKEGREIQKREDRHERGHNSGNRRAPASRDVHRSAGKRTTERESAEERGDDVGESLTRELLIGIKVLACPACGDFCARMSTDEANERDEGRLGHKYDKRLRFKPREGEGRQTLRHGAHEGHSVVAD